MLLLICLYDRLSCHFIYTAMNGKLDGLNGWIWFMGINDLRYDSDFQNYVLFLTFKLKIDLAMELSVVWMMWGQDEKMMGRG